MPLTSALSGSGGSHSGKVQLSKENLRLLIELSPVPVGRNYLQRSFEPSDTLEKDMERMLRELVREDLIEAYGKHKFVAASPWADIAIATAMASDDPWHPVALHVHNLPEQIPVTISLSRNQVRKHSIKPGDTLLCKLTRGDAFRLQAQFLKSVKTGHPVRLAGYFNKTVAGNTFTPGNTTIKGKMKLVDDAGISNGNGQKKVCIVELPPDFDVSHPAVILSTDQHRDTLTGQHVDDIILNRYGAYIPRGWKTAILRAAKKTEVPQELLEGRPVVTGISIDPAKKDVEIDDLIYAEETPFGFLTRAIISDVAALIRPNTTLDREAFRRGNSFYLSAMDIPMLPPEISLEKGSLVPFEDRPAICIEIQYDHSGKIIENRIYPAIAHSSGAYTYEEFGELVVNGSDNPCIEALRNFKEKFSLRTPPKLRTFLEREGNYNHFVGGSIVETMMVRANAATAAFLASRDAVFPFRNNGPSLDSVIYDAARQKLMALGITLPEKLESHNQLKDLLLRSLEGIGSGNVFSKAQSILAGLIEKAHYSISNCGHYGLGLHEYTHATSPLRRYADLLVQRALYREFSKVDPRWHPLAQTTLEQRSMEKMISHLNIQNSIQKNLRLFSSSSPLLGEMSYLQGNVMKVTVKEITDLGLVVFFHHNGFHELIPAERLSGDYHIDQQRKCLTFQDGRTVTNGGALLVSVRNINHSGIELNVQAPA